MVTLTAPGAREHTDQRTGQTCPCTPPGGVDLAAWNPAAGRAWNRLRTHLNRHGLEAYFRAAEVQKRGALHLHVLVATSDRLDVESLRAAAIAAGFGHEVDVAELVGDRAVRAALYAAKYVTKSTDQRAEVPWVAERVDMRTGEVRTVTDASYRTWSRSARWGVSMADIRAVIAASAAAREAANRCATRDSGVVESTVEPPPPVLTAPPPD
jgi:hypothetical protein